MYPHTTNDTPTPTPVVVSRDTCKHNNAPDMPALLRDHPASTVATVFVPMPVQVQASVVAVREH